MILTPDQFFNAYMEQSSLSLRHRNMTLFGGPNTYRTTIGLHIAHAFVRQGHHVLLSHEEMGGPTILRRIFALCGDDWENHKHLIHRAVPRDVGIKEAVIAYRPRFVLLDLLLAAITGAPPAALAADIVGQHPDVQLLSLVQLQKEPGGGQLLPPRNLHPVGSLLASRTEDGVELVSPHGNTLVHFTHDYLTAPFAHKE